ncbi:hypothetical protein AMJ49_06170 [Parcubacteria bacterium DG_74_2]|nr:MAG: hypothetical protein AMJ49_06170 [Parcubacteria bacterium DG_74_2]
MLTTKEKCINLRNKGLTLGEIIKKTQLPKTTIYYHIKNIPLSAKKKKQIQEDVIKRITEFSKRRKGKCIPGRIVPKPRGWTPELIFLVAHFIFDGEVRYGGCIYQNRSMALIDSVKRFMQNVFGLEPYYKFYKETGVHRISYHYVELATYFKRKVEELKKYIKTANLAEKRIFLQAFYDDEGCAYIWKRKRLIRGYQHNLRILKLIQKLLKDFKIESKIDKKYKEIIISRKENLIKFRDKINFSKGIYINPDRKKSIWKKKLEKREILNKAIRSYRE